MSRKVTTRQGDALDQIALEFYGRTNGATETLLDANPHLADLPPLLPAGVIIVLPDLPATPVKPRVRLWD
jgi:phage tail protein X